MKSAVTYAMPYAPGLFAVAALLLWETAVRLTGVPMNPLGRQPISQAACPACDHLAIDKTVRIC